MNSSRSLLVTITALVLLIWGPIDESWPAWLALRIGYLIAIPVALKFALDLVWRQWRPDAAAEDRLWRTIIGAVAGAFLLGAALAATQRYHYECTEVVGSREDSECVGTYRRVPGPDRGRAFLLTIFGVLAFRISMNSDSREGH